MTEISTSILTVEEENAIKTFYDLETAGTDYFHIDVMDGKFVEKDTREKMYKYTCLIKQISQIPLDVHFMVEDVKENIDMYLPLEPNIITIHYESFENDNEIIEMLKYIKDNNIKCGLSIKPNTLIEKTYNLLKYLNMILIMTVEPGKGGQKLIPETLIKVKKLKEYIKKEKLDTYIEVDGGINLDTAIDAKLAEVDIIVAGTAIINSEDYKITIQKLKK